MEPEITTNGSVPLRLRRLHQEHRYHGGAANAPNATTRSGTAPTDLLLEHSFELSDRFLNLAEVSLGFAFSL